MTDETADEIFGGTPRRSFTERMGRGAEHAPPPMGRHEGGYKAYSALTNGAVGAMCDVCRWMDGTNKPIGSALPYHLLMEVGYTDQEEIKLYYPDKIVVIHGRNLADLRDKLSRRMVSSIYEYNPRVWPMPPGDTPLIERIEMVRP